MRPKPKMLNRLSRILRSTQQHRITSRGSPQSQLVQRDALSTRFLDACTRGGSEAESRDGEFRHGEQAGVVSDGTDYHKGFRGGGVLVGSSVGGEGGEAGEGKGGPVYAGHEEASEDDFVEGGVGAA